MLKAISSFSGVGRRLERLKTKGSFELVDDYGHHPTEVKATLNAVCESRSKKPIVIFEPHRFSRTKLCWKQFVECFDEVDEVYLCEIYPASEEPIEGINSMALAKEINHRKQNHCTVLKNKDELFSKLNELQAKGEIVLSLGAGSIGKNVREWVKLSV